MRSLWVLAGVLSFAVASPAWAANANHPYQNCDKAVDNCGPTGNETTDQLNSQQLGGAATTPAPSGTPMAPPMAPRQ